MGRTFRRLSSLAPAMGHQYCRSRRPILLSLLVCIKCIHVFVRATATLPRSAEQRSPSVTTAVEHTERDRMRAQRPSRSVNAPPLDADEGRFAKGERTPCSANYGVIGRGDAQKGDEPARYGGMRCHARPPEHHGRRHAMRVGSVGSEVQGR